MPGPRLISADALSLGYGAGAPVVEGASLELSAGELVIVLGPNGGGKSTLIRAFAGELKPLAGALTVADGLAYLPQRDVARTDFPVSVLDVVLMGTLGERRLWQRAGRKHRTRATEALKRVGLAARARDSFGELSGGQRRRVLLARTIVQQAQAIALDEPLAGVDPASARAIRETLASLRDEGRLVLVTSHDVEHAREADRVICLNHRVIADGAPAAVLTGEALRATYADDLTVIPGDDGETVLAAADHCHDHEH